jgi:transcriptional regulator with XRE-family HTH domain
VERRTIVRTLRALRRRKRWSQRRLGQVLGISQAEVSRRECSALESCTIVDVEQWSTALGAHLWLDVRVDGERPLTDAAHAAMQSWLAGILRGTGWIVEPEVSFNHYGDRGRIDLLALHPGIRVLLVVEIKTRLVDAQELIGRLDVKRRVAPMIARERGWSPATTVPALVFREDSTTRRRLIAHEALFASYSLRWRSGLAWLRHPRLPVADGMLIVAMPRPQR